MRKSTINVQSNMDALLDSIRASNNVPRLLLHSCCAPCSTYVIEYLSNYFSITVYYYNPNIYPEDEYRFRARQQEDFIKRFPVANQIDFIEGEYNPKLFLEAASGLEEEPEGGKRCERCFMLRLGESAKMASKLNFDYFATTLTISPLKNANLINEIGIKLGEEFGVEYLPSEFRKRNGFLRSTQLSKEYDMYRQDFCGCEFSMKQRESERK